MPIFIKKLTIKNYKCFEEESIELNKPDGNLGSGLNILLGENGNGKTTVLEAINYLTLNSFSAENKLSINDFLDFKKEIIIEGNTDNFNCSSSIDFYKGWSFKSSGVFFKAKSRNVKERGHVLSSPFQINNYFIAEENYLKKDSSQGKEIDSRDKIFSKSRIIDDELNIFFFDKNRTRHITTGNYKTTFEKICDDLNWNFVKNLDEEKIENIIESIVGDYFKNVEVVTNKAVGKKTIKELKEFFGKDEFEHIKIEVLNLLHPFSNSFFALRDDNSLSQINARDLGSGIEIILTLLILKNIAGVSKGSIIYLIDEPELHLHPKAQSKLLDFLLEESRNKQIIISTQSPYLFKDAISEKAKLIMFTRDENDKIAIADASDTGWGLFRWSPSWGEINFFVYDMPTIEFHDELYGYLHERYISKATDKKEADNRGKQSRFETDYLQKKLKVERNWTPEFGGVAKNREDVTLPTFIRNKIHHPENKIMQSVDLPKEDELKQSINNLITLARTS